MIIPEKFDFKSSDEARETMTAFIRENFSDLLGPRINLIDQPNGIELIAAETARLNASAFGRPRVHLSKTA